MLGEVDKSLKVCQENNYIAEAVVCFRAVDSKVSVSTYLPWISIHDQKAAVDAVCGMWYPSVAPAAMVLSILGGIDPIHLHRYLKHSIYDVGEMDYEMHTAYARVLIQLLCQLRDLSGTGKEVLDVAPGAESGLVGVLRRELIEFLVDSTRYDSDQVLAYIRECSRLPVLIDSHQNVDPLEWSDLSSATDEQGTAADATPMTQTNGAHELPKYKPQDLKPLVRLVRFFEWHDPSQLDNLVVIVPKYRLSPKDFFAEMVDKYGPEPPVDAVDIKNITNSLPGAPPAAGSDGQPVDRKQINDAWLAHEQAIIYGKLRDHNAALRIYVYTLHDVRMAEEYCYSGLVTQHGSSSNEFINQLRKTNETEGRETPNGQHEPGRITPANRSPGHQPLGSERAGSSSKGNSASQGVLASFAGLPASNTLSSRTSAALTTLIGILLQPPIAIGGKASHAPKLAEAMRLCDKYSRAIPPQAILNVIPADIPVASVAPYLSQVFQTMSHLRTMGMVGTASLKSTLLDAEQHLTSLQSRFVYVDKHRPCVVCGKPIGTSVCGVFPNLKIAHFRCFKDKDMDPERGVPFKPE